MSRQYWVELIAWATANGTAVNTTTSETILFPNTTIPANYMQDGRSLRLRAMGSYGTVSATPGVNFIWSIRLGGVAGVVVCKSGGIITPTTTALVAGLWDLEVYMTTRSNGSSGTIMGNGIVHLHDTTVQTMRSATNIGATGPMTNGGQATPAVATVDLTADQALSVTITMSASSGTNTMTGMNYTLESMN